MTIKELRNILVNNYTTVVKRLMRHDRNARWDEILEEKENDLIEATREMIMSLKQAIADSEDDETRDFYKNSLEILNRIK